MSIYAGMTVNERLAIAGMITDRDKAVLARDRSRMIQILRAVELSARQKAFIGRAVSRSCFLKDHTPFYRNTRHHNTELGLLHVS